MKKIVVYCHGFGSDAKTDKVFRLYHSLPDVEVYAWNIPVDPEIAIPHLTQHVDMDILVNNPIEEEAQLIFVGTSLGGWYASKLADIYRADAILINPSYNPRLSLQAKGVDKQVADKYSEISWSNRYHYFISRNDEVIDFNLVAMELARVNTKYYEHTDHRFNGPEFDDVVALINEL